MIRHADATIEAGQEIDHPVEPSNETVFRADQLTVSYSKVTELWSVYIDVQKDQVVGYIRSIGAEKTTFADTAGGISRSSRNFSLLRSRG